MQRCLSNGLLRRSGRNAATRSKAIPGHTVFSAGRFIAMAPRMEAVVNVENFGDRLQFLDNAPANFINLINDHVWDVDQHNRYSMKRVYEFLKEMEEDNGHLGGNNGTTDDNGGQSTVINALIGRTNFREGNINV
ncbi:hypothetical protein niasHS_016619 [Heterodera schachtii]|uniref:Uncharacterized protein n=1 Tax=Heterodera schachtii TaxID=97005 RepID=A0ABD2I8C7_HETSC